MCTLNSVQTEPMESKPIEWLTARCIQLFTGNKKDAKKRLSWLPITQVLVITL